MFRIISLAAFALAATASAQTFTAPPAASYLSSVELVDKTPGDGVIRFTVKRGGIAAKRDAKLCADYRPSFLYVRADVACPTIVEVPVTPPVEPPITPPVVIVTPPPVTVPSQDVVAAAEAFRQTPNLTVGFNGGGGLGTLRAAPAGFRTDTATGLYRVGFYHPFRDDLILQGRAIEGFGFILSGKRYANLALSGASQIPGAFLAADRWEGGAAGIAVTQISTVTDNLGLAVTLTNTTAQTVTLRYFRSVDPDQSDLYSTTNRAIAGGVESVLLGKGGTFFLRDLAGKATVATTSNVNKAADIGTTLPTGKTLKGDYVVQLVFDAVTLAPGQSVTHLLEEGLRL